MNGKENKQKRLSEEEKKKKFGDKYDPDYKLGAKGKKGKCADKGKNEHPIPEKNPWELYAINEQIAKDLGSFAYAYMTGAPIDLEYINGTNQTQIMPKWYAGNIIRLGYIPAQYAEPNKLSALNMTSTQLYQYVRQSNSGARNYEPADMMMVILALRDIYAEFFELKRALGIAQFFPFENRTFPDGMLTVLGFDAADLRKNYSVYRGQLNLLAEKINSFAIPKYFKAFERTAFVTSNVFADSSSIRGQFYVYVKEGYYTLSSTSAGTAVNFTPRDTGLSSSAIKFSARLAVIESQLNAVALDTDANTIMGDILKAFGDSEVYQLGSTDEKYTVVPLFNEDALAQIENMVSLSTYIPRSLYADKGNWGTTLNVTQENGNVKWQPVWTGNEAVMPVGTVIPTQFRFNSHKDEPTFKDNLEWSRLMITGTLTVGATKGVEFAVTSCGLELVTQISMHTASPNSSVPANMSRTYIDQYINDSTIVSGATVVIALLRLMQFDWHPFIEAGHLNSGVGASITIGGDLKKYTFIAQSNVKSLNDSATAASFFNRELFTSVTKSR